MLRVETGSNLRLDRSNFGPLIDLATTRSERYPHWHTASVARVMRRLSGAIAWGIRNSLSYWKHDGQNWADPAVLILGVLSLLIAVALFWPLAREWPGTWHWHAWKGWLDTPVGQGRMSGGARLQNLAAALVVATLCFLEGYFKLF